MNTQAVKAIYTFEMNRAFRTWIQSILGPVIIYWYGGGLAIQGLLTVGTTVDARGCPIDLSADASIGGVVATNAGGCRVLRHGDLRQGRRHLAHRHPRGLRIPQGGRHAGRDPGRLRLVGRRTRHPMTLATPVVVTTTETMGER